MQKRACGRDSRFCLAFLMGFSQHVEQEGFKIHRSEINPSITPSPPQLEVYKNFLPL